MPATEGKLPLRTKIGYGFGHMMNDLVGAAWVTYLLVFLVQIIKLEKTLSGIILYIGQFCDGIATLFIGYFSGFKYDLWLCNKLGNKRSWHAIATVILLFSCPFLFNPVFDYTAADQASLFTYYAFFVVCTAFGWAVTENSHLAIIPDLTSSQNEKTGLVALRYAVYVGSNMFIFLLTWLMIKDGGKIGPKDAYVFGYIMLICCGMGIVTTALYFILVRVKNNNSTVEEPADRVDQDECTMKDDDDTPPNSTGSSTSTPMAIIKKWLKYPQLYQIALLHSTSRLVNGLATVYMPLYLQNTLEMPSKYVATIPLTMFVSSFVASACLKKINNILGRKTTFIIGSLIAIGGQTFLQFGCNPGDENVQYFIYVVAVIMGIGGTTLAVTSIALVAEMIGENTDASSFVYAFMSLTEKLPSGAIIVLIQYFTPTDMDTNPDSRLYYRDVLSYINFCATLLGAASMLSLWPKIIGEKAPTISSNSSPGSHSPIIKNMKHFQENLDEGEKDKFIFT